MSWLLALLLEADTIPIRDDLCVLCGAVLPASDPDETFVRCVSCGAVIRRPK